jgi:hypothetical protein
MRMSDKCETCKNESKGVGGCAFPCHLCTENDAIKFIFNHLKEKDVIEMLCRSLNISFQTLKDNKKNYYKEEAANDE